jgi:hypothetical protein
MWTRSISPFLDIFGTTEPTDTGNYVFDTITAGKKAFEHDLMLDPSYDGNFKKLFSFDYVLSEKKNNNNTFTWSGPSGVLDCTGQRRIAPAAGWCKSGTHKRETVVSLCH